MSKIVIRGIETHYQTRGEGPDVILIHGLSASLATWYNGMMPSVVEAGFRVTVYDLRGHGLTQLTPTGYTSLNLAADLEALLDALGIDRALIAGHSFGGAIAMHFAVLYPERTRGVVLLDGGIACLRHLRIVDDWDGWDRPGMKEAGFTLEWFRAVDSNPDMSEYLAKTLAVPRQRGFRRGQNGYTPRLRRLIEESSVGVEFREIAGLTEERLQEVQAPVLALYGAISLSQKIGIHLAALMPNCRAVNLPGLGHFAALHDPKPILGQMIPFFRDPRRFIEQAKEASGFGETTTDSVDIAGLSV